MKETRLVVVLLLWGMMGCGETPPAPIAPDSGSPLELDSGPTGDPFVVLVDDTLDPIAGTATVRIEQNGVREDANLGVDDRASFFVDWARGRITVTVLANDRMTSVVDLGRDGLSTFPVVDGVLTIPLEAPPGSRDTDALTGFTVPRSGGTVVADRTEYWYLTETNHEIFVDGPGPVRLFGLEIGSDGRLIRAAMRDVDVADGDVVPLDWATHAATATTFSASFALPEDSHTDSRVSEPRYGMRVSQRLAHGGFAPSSAAAAACSPSTGASVVCEGAVLPHTDGAFVVAAYGYSVSTRGAGLGQTEVSVAGSPSGVMAFSVVPLAIPRGTHPAPFESQRWSDPIEFVTPDDAPIRIVVSPTARRWVMHLEPTARRVDLPTPILSLGELRNVSGSISIRVQQCEPHVDLGCARYAESLELVVFP